MSVEVCFLASGSGGNCTVLRCPAGVMLIDIGIGPRSTARRLDGTDVTLPDIRAICLTHLDGDHFNRNWLATVLRQGIRIFCHERCRDEVVASAPGMESLVHTFDGQSFQPMPELRLHPIRFAHDREGSHGFLVEGFGCRIGYATDLGHVPDGLLGHFQDVDLLAMESNYDPEMELNSPRPAFLKHRIMGGSGHLSNPQAFQAICQLLDAAEERGSRLPAHIVLLHRSRDCNCPNLLRKLFSQDPRIASRLVLAEQHHRSQWLGPRRSPRAGEQLSLADLI